MAVRAENRSRWLDVLERLLAVPTADMEVALSSAADLIAAAFGADKVDAFLYDAARDSLVALGVSRQPLSDLQKRCGLDVLPVSNGGRVVEVFRTGKTFVTGNLQDDPDELRGIKEALGIRSKLGVPLDVGGVRRGMIMIASLQPDLFDAEDARFAESVARWVGVVAHRTELVAAIARQAAEHSRQAVAEEILLVLAHDLRNYLSPIDLRLQRLSRRAANQQRSSDVDDLQIAERNLVRIQAMIDEILDVARLEGGVLAMDPDSVELVATLRESAATLGTPEQPVEVKAGQELVVRADPARIRQCVDNLLNNAIKHSPSGAAVTVQVSPTVTPAGEAARVEIIDQGPGVAPELLPHVFERFVSGDRRAGGLGLGLYLAKRIAVMHGGDLTVSSPPGAGARFILTLPCTRG